MNINIVKHYKIWFMVSAVVIILGLAVGLFFGFNSGIDFSGGTMFQIDMGQTVEPKAIKELIASFDLSPDVNLASDEGGQDFDNVIIKTAVSLDNDQRNEVFQVIKEAYQLEDTDFLKSEQFGPTIGNEIKKRALYSVLLASVGMLLYISFRFEFRFGIAAIIALLHDVLVLLAIYAIFRVPVNSAFIAAVLTVVGYSINDTIVVFDRIRENLKYAKTSNYFLIANESLNQTLTRSINTSLTTLLVIGSLLVLGVDSIKELAFPLMAGIATGTYSSIFIASPVWALLKSGKK